MIRINKIILVAVVFLTGATAWAGGSICGNAIMEDRETCDDGNTQIGDGCSAQCAVESGFECSATYLPLANNAVPDGGFEAGSPSNFWNEQTTQNPSVVCSVESCPQEFGARQGAWWARFGSLEQPGESRIDQFFFFPSTHKFLDFDIMQPVCDGSVDRLEVQIDEVTIFVATGADARCGNKDYYEHQLINLETAPGGPYNDDQDHGLTIRAETFFELNNPTLFLIDNVRIGEVAGAPTPSVCEFDHLTIEYADFDPGIRGDFSLIDYTTFELRDPIPWGTTDDGVCGTGDIPPGNFTGGAGEAACLDANAAGGGEIFSFFCTDAIDLTDAAATQLSFLANVQFGQGSPNDFFTVLAGSEPPDPGTIGNYQDVFTTFENLGDFAEPIGVQIDLSLDFLDGEPAAFICFGFSSTMALYSQVDNIDVSAFGCTDNDDSDKLQSCFDNCTERTNQDQTDSDGDGYGNACDGDISRELVPTRVPGGNGNDCIVNFVDLGFLRNAFFSDPTSANWNPDADFNNDLVINVEDLGRMKQFFFGIPGPSGYTSACEMAP